MNTKPAKETAAIIVFALLEMMALRLLISASLKVTGLAGLLPSDAAFVVLCLAIGAGGGYLVGWLLFKKWSVSFGVKAATAAGVVLASFVLSYWTSMVILRSAADATIYW